MAATNKKVNECFEKALNSLSVIGRPIVLKHEQKVLAEVALLAIAEKYKTNMKSTFFPYCKPIQITTINSCSDWFS